ncbi:WD domain-containing protein [Macrophomina phaseolina]|uniref:WD domain-containing protein n=1 Tax=Macrophomina phaseolina TaxID=35725 RepID=A0ABQ8GJW7_9PEZI|nr:WD domain-containing protein [Macrophomina phaseolina]
MSTPLHHACTRTPVTALAYTARYICAAEGPFLRVFLKIDSRCVLTEKVFENQSVHGLVVIDDSQPDCLTLIAYGGRLVRCLRLAHDEVARTFALDRGPAARVSDWVLDLAHPYDELDHPPSSSALASDPHATTTVAVTAHNQIVRLCCTSTSPSTCTPTVPLLTVSDLTVSSRCILYSAHLSWLSPTKVLVASGTAFGEILVWSCDFSDRTQPRSSVHHFFTGHEGSIFGVQISPKFNPTDDYGGSHHQLLASCSDDRTVRIWDISHLPLGRDFSTSDDALGLVQDRETGFGANATTEQENCLAVAWGHISRVWAIRFVSSPAREGFRLVSFGEDATSRVWDLSCQSCGQGQLPRLELNASLLTTRAFHVGKNIWAMGLAPSPDLARFETVTGAADSAVVSYHWPLEPLESVSPQPTTDAHRCCSFVSDSLVISATNSGKIIRGRRDANEFIWEAVGQVDDLRGYSVSVGLPECGMAFLAGSSGAIRCYQDFTRESPIVAQVSRKVSGIFASHFCKPDGTSIISLIVTSVGAKTAESFLFSWDTDSLRLALMQKAVLQLPRSFVVTSALYTPTSNQALIFLGARSGLVAIFSNQAPERNPTEAVFESNAVIELHAPETVTSLAWLSYDSSSHHSTRLGHLLSVGRDGRYAATEIFSDRPAVIAHQLSLPFGPNVEGCFVDKGVLIVYGFRGKHFVVVNASTEQELFSVECGGAHRIWSFCASKTGEGGIFVWNQASTLKLYSADALSHRTIRSGGHGREIKAAAACPSDPRIVATGAEDTTIRIFEYTTHDGCQPDFRCVGVLRKHVTGIQHLAWSESGNWLFSSGGYEEFFVWRTRRLPVIGLGVVCEAVCLPESELPDLRIMSFDVQEKPSIESEFAEFVITLVYSDSTIRTYSYTSTPAAKTFSLLYAATYLTSCLTQATRLNTSLLLTAGTDGHIAFWPLPNPSAFQSTPMDAETLVSPDPLPLAFLTRKRIHQSTIKSFASHRLSSTLTVLLTAGDDNAIAFTLLQSGESVDCSHTSTLFIPRAHAATVTGVVLLASQPVEKHSSTRLLAVTSGSDQRVKLWEVVINVEKASVDGLNVKRLADQGTAVADVSDVVALAADAGDDRRTVVVVGVGMEAWTVDIQ